LRGIIQVEMGVIPTWIMRIPKKYHLNVVYIDL